jgi:hypothetical protein
MIPKFDHLGLDGRTALKGSFEYFLKLYDGFLWPRIGSSGGLL